MINENNLRQVYSNSKIKHTTVVYKAYHGPPHTIYCVLFSDCPTDTIQFVDHCYWISTDQLAPDDAQTLCHTSGGTLAKTTDDDIYTFIYSLFIR